MGYRYGPVVVAVDGSASSIGALHWGAAEARQHSRKLLAVHVRRPDEPGGQPSELPPADLANAAAEEARRWLPGVCATGVTETGDAVELLRRHSQTARLVVVGSHGTGGAHGKPVGTVAEALGLRANCPVLIVQAAERWADPLSVLPRAGPVIVGFDGSGPAHRALELGFVAAADRCCELVVLQVWQHPDLWQPGHDRHGRDLAAERADAQAALRDAAAPWHARHPLVELQLRTEPGAPAQALCAASQWATLMVLGTRRSTDAERPDTTSVTRRVLRQMACPALIAHDPGRPPPLQRPQPAAVRRSVPT